MVVGHQKQLDFLYQSALGGRLAHAYIFSGPSQVGKKSTALEWLEELLQALAHADANSGSLVARFAQIMTRAEQYVSEMDKRTKDK